MFSDSAVYELKKIKPDELMETVLGDEPDGSYEFKTGCKNR